MLLLLLWTGLLEGCGGGGMTPLASITDDDVADEEELDEGDELVESALEFGSEMLIDLGVLFTQPEL